MTKLKIYGASMTQHRGVWTQLARTPQWDGFEFVSRWPIDFGTKRLDSNPDHARQGWIENFEDLVQCDVVLVYFYPGDVLRGALVELGAGIALGKQVILIGNPGGTWMHHPAVTQVTSLDQALYLLSSWVENGLPTSPSNEEPDPPSERDLNPDDSA